MGSGNSCSMSQMSLGLGAVDGACKQLVEGVCFDDM